MRTIFETEITISVSEETNNTNAISSTEEKVLYLLSTAETNKQLDDIILYVLKLGLNNMFTKNILTEIERKRK
jgi:hypothetical protein